MHSNYEDILSRIEEKPSWYDANGAPRYGPFTPEMCPNIYAEDVVLLRIRCQACGQHFDVEMHDGDVFRPLPIPRGLHYGDPPAHGCALGGDTETCDDLMVLEVWRRMSVGDWRRCPSFEGPMDE